MNEQSPSTRPRPTEAAGSGSGVLWSSIVAAVLGALVVASGSLMASSDDRAVEEPRPMRTRFATRHVDGTLLSITERRLIVESRLWDDAFYGVSTHSYAIGPGQRFCRATCGETWRSLEIGDQLVGRLVALTGDEPPPSRPVLVNFRADKAIVDTFVGDRLVVRSTRGLAPSVPYELLVTSETIVVWSDGEVTSGLTRSLAPGQWIYYTGSADGPTTTASTTAYRLFPG